jgi:hypothetical protein
MFWNAPFCMCAIRRVNEAHSKIQLNRFRSIFWSNEQYDVGEGGLETKNTNVALARCSLSYALR